MKLNISSILEFKRVNTALFKSETNIKKRKFMKLSTGFLVCFLCTFTLSNAQNERQTRADKYFKMRAYAKAADLYESKEHTQNVLQNLGDSYYYNSNMQKAIKTYRELFKTHSDSLDLDYYFRYGQALKGVENYDEADKYLSIYYNTKINTLAFIENNRVITPHVFSLEKQGVDDGTSNFGMTYYGDNKVAFASTRNENNPAYAWNDLPYLDIYSATISPNGELTDIVPFSEAINTDSHESNPTFTKDGKTMYFNRTNTSKNKTDGERIAHIKIYRAEFVDGQWTNVQPLSFTSNNFSTEHPSLTNDGKTLYFASDMPGGYGSFDIYKVAINADGSFGEPENLGNSINTEQREQFPNANIDNKLYFASDGHLGFGGLDIFMSDYENGKYTKPVNLGATLNSNLDDLGFLIDEEDNVGYISSNRSGYDQNYSFSRTENILSKYQVKGIVQNSKNNVPLPGALVTLLDDSNNILQDSIVGSKGEYLFKLEPNKTYTIKAALKAYVPQMINFSTDSDGQISHNIALTLESFVDKEEIIEEDELGIVKVELDKIYFDFDKSAIRPDAATILDILVDIMKKYPTMEIEVSAHTDVRGDDGYNLQLSKQRAASVLEYITSRGIDRNRLKSEGYGETRPINRCIEPGMCSKEEYEENRRSEFKVIN